MSALPPLLRSLVRRTGLAPALQTLAHELSASELNSFLLHVFRARAQDVSYPDLLRQGERDKLFHVSDIDARLLHTVDGAAFESAAAFTAVELSPVSPFGINARAGIDQNNVLTALRGAEVMADPTSALAIEIAARRRHGDRTQPTRIVTSARCIRMQPLDDPSFSRHFRIHTLVSGLRASKEEQAEQQELYQHVVTWCRMLQRLNGRGFHIDAVQVEVSDTRLMRTLLSEQGISPDSLQGYQNPQSWEQEIQKRNLRFPGVVTSLHGFTAPRGTEGILGRLGMLERVVFEPLRSEFPEVSCAYDLRRLHGLNYYEGLAFHLVLRSRDGRSFPVGDGGFTTWTQSLLSDRSERLLCSAIGSEFLCRVFRG